MVKKNLRWVIYMFLQAAQQYRIKNDIIDRKRQSGVLAINVSG
jgi:hypothetical protein